MKTPNTSARLVERLNREIETTADEKAARVATERAQQHSHDLERIDDAHDLEHQRMGFMSVLEKTLRKGHRRVSVGKAVGRLARRDRLEVGLDDFGVNRFGNYLRLIETLVLLTDKLQPEVIDGVAIRNGWRIRIEDRKTSVDTKIDYVSQDVATGKQEVQEMFAIHSRDGASKLVGHPIDEDSYLFVGGLLQQAAEELQSRWRGGVALGSIVDGN